MCVCRESQGFTEDQEKEKDKDITDEGWNSQKQLSSPVEQKKRHLYLHPKLSPGLVPYRLFN